MREQVSVIRAGVRTSILRNLPSPSDDQGLQRGVLAFAVLQQDSVSASSFHNLYTCEMLKLRYLGCGHLYFPNQIILCEGKQYVVSGDILRKTKKLLIKFKKG